jgi:hypothetical protein
MNTTLRVLAGSLLLLVRVAASQTSIQSLMPSADATRGWTVSDTARVYPGKDLYLFIDGGADLFLEYGFERALAAEYRNADAATLSLEVYEMRDPAAAYGIYSIRSGEGSPAAALGQEAISRPYYSMFWKGKFYVSVAVSDSSSPCRNGMMAVAHAVDRAIAESGKKPGLVELLPKDDLRKLRYISGYLGFSAARALDLQGIFPATDGAVGSYGDHTLVVMRYPTADDAERRSGEIDRHLSTDTRSPSLRREGHATTAVGPAGQTVSMGQAGRYIVFGIAAVDSLAVRALRETTRALSKQ